MKRKCKRKLFASKFLCVCKQAQTDHNQLRDISSQFDRKLHEDEGDRKSVMPAPSIMSGRGPFQKFMDFCYKMGNLWCLYTWTVSSESLFIAQLHVHKSVKFIKIWGKTSKVKELDKNNNNNRNKNKQQQLNLPAAISPFLLCSLAPDTQPMFWSVFWKKNMPMFICVWGGVFDLRQSISARWCRKFVVCLITSIVFFLRTL